MKKLREMSGSRPAIAITAVIVTTVVVAGALPAAAGADGFAVTVMC